jgi:hypothetical protein
VDQQLAGLFMWIPAGFIFTLLGIALCAAWLEDPSAARFSGRGRAHANFAPGRSGNAPGFTHPAVDGDAARPGTGGSARKSKRGSSAGTSTGRRLAWVTNMDRRRLIIGSTSGADVSTITRRQENRATMRDTAADHVSTREPQQAPRDAVRGAAAEPRIERIARRAHELYEARGGTEGRALEDWLQAEREIDAES